MYLQKREDTKMNMFRREGFCPTSSFFGKEVFAHPEHERIRTILGDRIYYMVYDNQSRRFCFTTSITDAFFGDANSLLGIQTANYLQAITPECSFPGSGRKILIRDVLNPEQIDKDIRFDFLTTPDIFNRSVVWEFENKGNIKCIKGNRRIFYDDRYLIVIQNNQGENAPVEIYLFKFQ